MSNAQVIARSSARTVSAPAHEVSRRESTYRGKYPKRIRMVSGGGTTGLYLLANDGTAVRLDKLTAYALCQALGKTKNGPQLGDDITPWLPAARGQLRVDIRPQNWEHLGLSILEVLRVRGNEDFAQRAASAFRRGQPDAYVSAVGYQLKRCQALAMNGNEARRAGGVLDTLRNYGVIV